MIKIIKNSDFFPDLKKDIHYISWTPFSVYSITSYSKLDWVDAVIRQNVESYYDIEGFYAEVDAKHYPKTLYPLLNVTLMPSFGREYSSDELERQLEEIIHIQCEKIHAKNIMIDMRNHTYFDSEIGSYNNSRFFKILNDVLEKHKKLYEELENTIIYIAVRGDHKYSEYDEASEKEIEELTADK